MTLIVATLSSDTTMRRLLGARTNDPRVYRYYEPDAVVSDTQPAYITVALTARPERTGAVREPVFTLALWGSRYEGVVETVRDRVLELLDFSSRPKDYLTTESGEAVQPIVIGEHDSAQENTKFAGRQLVFRFGGSAV